MRQGQDIVGKQVISIAEGKIVGRVRDLYLDEGMTRLVGIHLGTEGLIRKKNYLIPTEAVRVFGADVMLIDDDDSVREAKAYSESDSWIRMDRVTGRDVDTSGGTRIGTIANIAFGEDGEIIAYTLNKVFVDGPIKENRYIVANAVINNGGEKGALTIDLARAEAMGEEVPGEKQPLVTPAEPIGSIEIEPVTPSSQSRPEVEIIEPLPEPETASINWLEPDPVSAESIPDPAPPSEIVIEDVEPESEIEPFVIEELERTANRDSINTDDLLN